MKICYTDSNIRQVERVVRKGWECSFWLSGPNSTQHFFASITSNQKREPIIAMTNWIRFCSIWTEGMWGKKSRMSQNQTGRLYYSAFQVTEQVNGDSNQSPYGIRYKRSSAFLKTRDSGPELEYGRVMQRQHSHLRQYMVKLNVRPPSVTPVSHGLKARCR